MGRQRRGDAGEDLRQDGKFGGGREVAGECGRERGRSTARARSPRELERQQRQDLASFADRWVPLVRLILRAAFARAGWSAEWKPGP